MRLTRVLVVGAVGAVTVLSLYSTLPTLLARIPSHAFDTSALDLLHSDSSTIQNMTTFTPVVNVVDQEEVRSGGVDDPSPPPATTAEESHHDGNVEEEEEEGGGEKRGAQLPLKDELIPSAAAGTTMKNDSGSWLPSLLDGGGGGVVSRKRLAYATLLSGASPTGAYRGYLYNILVANHLLQRYIHPPEDWNTTLWPLRGDALASLSFDFVVFLVTNGGWTRLPENEEALLVRAGIIIRYVRPYFGEPSFYTSIMLKLEAVSLIEYDSVVFMDCDVIPLWPMTHFADHFTLRSQNVFWSWRVSPMNAGFFVVRPNETDYRALVGLAMRFRNTTWDAAIGWGVDLSKDGGWLDWDDNVGGLDWGFNSGHADQGILYYYYRYVVKDVAILSKKTVAEIVGDKVTRRPRSDIFDKHAPEGSRAPPQLPLSSSWERLGPISGGACVPRRCTRPYNFFFHFTSKSKPWLHKAPNSENGSQALQAQLRESTRPGSQMNPTSLWYDVLREVVQIFGLEIDVANLHTEDLKSPVGYYSVAKHIERAWQSTSNAPGDE